MAAAILVAGDHINRTALFDSRYALGDTLLHPKTDVIRYHFAEKFRVASSPLRLHQRNETNRCLVEVVGISQGTHSAQLCFLIIFKPTRAIQSDSSQIEINHSPSRGDVRSRCSSLASIWTCRRMKHHTKTCKYWFARVVVIRRRLCHSSTHHGISTQHEDHSTMLSRTGVVAWL